MGREAAVVERGGVPSEIRIGPESARNLELDLIQRIRARLWNSSFSDGRRVPSLAVREKVCGAVVALMICDNCAARMRVCARYQPGMPLVASIRRAVDSLST
jgi:hypothetical protein